MLDVHRIEGLVESSGEGYFERNWKFRNLNWKNLKPTRSKATCLPHSKSAPFKRRAQRLAFPDHLYRVWLLCFALHQRVWGPLETENFRFYLNRTCWKSSLEYFNVWNIPNLGVCSVSECSVSQEGQEWPAFRRFQRYNLYENKLYNLCHLVTTKLFSDEKMHSHLMSSEPDGDRANNELVFISINLVKIGDQWRAFDGESSVESLRWKLQLNRFCSSIKLMTTAFPQLRFTWESQLEIRLRFKGIPKDSTKPFRFLGQKSWRRGS